MKPSSGEKLKSQKAEAICVQKFLLSLLTACTQIAYRLLEPFVMGAQVDRSMDERVSCIFNTSHAKRKRQC